MQSSLNSNQIPNRTQDADRIVDLRVWLIRNRVTYRMIGAALGGITGHAVQKMVAKDHVPCARHAQLLAYGIPEDLLPPALDVRSGPKTKEKALEQSAQATA